MNGITFVATKELSKEAKLKLGNMLKRRDERMNEIVEKFRKNDLRWQKIV